MGGLKSVVFGFILFERAPTMKNKKSECQTHELIDVI